MSAIYSLFLVLTLNPGVQRKAQEEIDKIVGSDRLPTLGDRDRLPYIDALTKEILRFNPVVNLG